MRYSVFWWEVVKRFNVYNDIITLINLYIISK